MNQADNLQPRGQNVDDQKLGLLQAEAMQVIEAPGSDQAKLRQAVATLQTNVIPTLEAIVAAEGERGKPVDALYLATAREQLTRACQHVITGSERLGIKPATAA